MKFFGSGTLIGKTSDAVPQSIKFGTLQDVSLDFSFTLKELYGSKQFPDDIGRGTAKITGKAKQGNLDADAFGRLFFNVAPTSPNQLLAAIDEAAAVPATPGPYTHVVTNGATFSSDEGVRYAATGVRLLRVASGPTVGEYSVDETTGTYTFAAADQGVAMLISYVYTATTGGANFTITSNILGDSPNFGVLFTGTRTTGGVTRQCVIELNRCISSKLTLASKLEDFMIPEFDFSAMADDSGTVGKMSFTS